MRRREVLFFAKTDQARRIEAYNGTSKVATVTRAWDVVPDDGTSGYVILPTGAIIDDDIAEAVWNAAIASYGSAGSYGQLVESGNVGGGAIVAATVTDKAGYSLSAAGVTAVTDDVFAEQVEGALTFRQWVRRVASILFGKASGGGGAGHKKFRDMSDAIDRVHAITDADRNRTGITFDDS